MHTNSGAEQGNKQVDTERAAALLGSPYVRQNARGESINGTSPKASEKARCNQHLLGVCKPTDQIPDQKPDIRRVEDVLPAVDLRQGPDEEWPNRSRQQVDREGHGGLGGVHIELCCNR